MSFKYSCFISYCHGQGDLMKRFIYDLKKALDDYIEPYLDEEVYIDEKRLKPGYHFNKSLACAVCKSVCMIVVYIPKYDLHEYCLKEFAAMKELERKRYEKLGKKNAIEQGLIIPIIFRGKEDDIPDEIKNHIHYQNFSKFTMATPEISVNEEYISKIEDIAEYIHEVYKMFKSSGKDFCCDCDSFEFPKTVKPLKSKETPKELPLRKEGL